jgi:hypothetical protein
MGLLIELLLLSHTQSLCAMRDMPWYLDPTTFTCNQTYILLLFHQFICTGEECPAMFRQQLIESNGCNRHSFHVYVVILLFNAKLGMQ